MTKPQIPVFIRFLRFSYLHGNPSKCICYRAEKNNCRKDRAKILDHKIKNFLSAESTTFLQYFIFNFLCTDYSGYQKTGSNRCNRHHDRVRQEIKEIKELHSNDLNTRQRTIAKRRKTSENNHDNSDKYCCLLASPFQLILKSRYCTLSQGNRTGQGCTENQYKKQDSNQSSKAHACKYLPNRNKH